jgi:hypothetical protein
MVVTEQTALQLPSLLAAVNTLATDVALLPLGVYQRARTAGAARPASTRPTAWSGSRPTARRPRSAGANRGCSTRSCTATATPRSSAPAAGPPTPSTCSTPARRARSGSTTGPATSSTAAAGSRPPTCSTWPGLGFDGLTGFNFVRLLREAIGLGMGAQSYAADYFQNGAEPGGVIETPAEAQPRGPGQPPRRLARPPRRAGQPPLRGRPRAGGQVGRHLADPEKSQLNETRKYQLLDTIRPWRLPPHKAGDFSQAHLPTSRHRTSIT